MLRFRFTVPALMIAGHAFEIAAVLLVAFVAISGVQALHSFSHDIYLHPSSASNAALEFQLQTTRIHGDLLQLATGDDPVIAARLAREITDEELVAREQLRTVRRTLPSEVRQVGELESLMNRWQALRAKVVELAAAGEATKARQLTQSEGTRLFLEIDRRSHHLVGLVRNRAAQFAGEMEAVSNRSLFWMWTAAIAMILLILLSSWRITRAVVLLHREVDRQARRDPLTGVANYRQFLELARPALARSRRLKSPASLLVVDFDHFKTINDTWGHEVGNNALQAFCRLASSTIRGSDLLGRLGGDGVPILLPPHP